MNIALCCDHGGLALKNAIIKYLQENGYGTEDFGTTSENSCDYPDFALRAAEAVAEGKCERGIFVCTTGIGISIAANKDANALALGGGIVGVKLALEIVKTFLETPFSEEEKHKRRISKITAIERKYNKER